MGNPRPSFRRAKNYDSQGRFECGRLGGYGWAEIAYNSEFAMTTYCACSDWR